MIPIVDLPPESWGIDETSLWIFSRSPLVVAVRLFGIVEVPGQFGDIDAGLPFTLLDSVPEGSLSVLIDGVEANGVRVGIGGGNGASLAFIVPVVPETADKAEILFRGDVCASAGIPDGSGGGLSFLLSPRTLINL